MTKQKYPAMWNKWFLPSELCNMIINECESNLDLSDGVTGGGLNRSTRDSQVAVSYTHLTLPTISDV